MHERASNGYEDLSRGGECSSQTLTTTSRRKEPRREEHLTGGVIAFSERPRVRPERFNRVTTRDLGTPTARRRPSRHRAPVVQHPAYAETTWKRRPSTTEESLVIVMCAMTTG